MIGFVTFNQIISGSVKGLEKILKSIAKRFSIGGGADIDEDNHPRILAGLFGSIGSLLSFIFFINSLFLSDYYLSFVLFIVCSSLLISYLIINSNKYAHLHNAVRHISLVAVLLFGAYLVCTGGLNNSGPLWIFIIPPVALAFFGLKIGVVYNVIFLIVICVLLLFPDDLLLTTEYSYEFKSRMIYAFLASSALSICYEASRYKSFEQLKSLTRQYKLESKEDELTRLTNRRGMWEILTSENNQSKQNDSGVVLALCDIDYFKRVNDVYGHDIGDQILKHVSYLAKTAIRDGDVLARWGGEEFLLLMPDTNENAAVNLVESICTLIQGTPYSLEDGEKINVTLSAGVCEISPLISIHNAITLSDKCLYQAKNTGRNKVVPYSQYSV